MSIKSSLVARALFVEALASLSVLEQVRAMAAISDFAVQDDMWVLVTAPGGVFCSHCGLTVIANTNVWNKLVSVSHKYLHNSGVCKDKVYGPPIDLTSFGFDDIYWEELKGAAASVLRIAGVESLIEFAECSEQTMTDSKAVK